MFVCVQYVCMPPYITCICSMNLWINFSGKWLGSRQIRCNWATKGAGANEDKLSSDAKSVVELTNSSSGESDTT